MKIQKIFIGGWFQRTTLHLSEIFDFLKGKKSPLDLDAQRLDQLRKKLNLDSVEMKIEEFELIEINAKNKIKVNNF